MTLPTSLYFTPGRTGGGGRETHWFWGQETLTNLYGLHHAVVGSLNQIPTYLIHHTHKHCLIQVSMETTVVHSHINWGRMRVMKFPTRGVYPLLQMSPSCSSLVSGIPWQMTSFTEVQQDLGKW